MLNPYFIEEIHGPDGHRLLMTIMMMRQKKSYKYLKIILKILKFLTPKKAGNALVTVLVFQMSMGNQLISLKILHFGSKFSSS